MCTWLTAWLADSGLPPGPGLYVGMALFAAGSDGRQIDALAALKRQQQRQRLGNLHRKTLVSGDRGH